MLKAKMKVKRKPEEAMADIRKRVTDMTKIFEKMPRIAVGLPKNSMLYPDGTSVIMVGFWNEFGSTDGAVPSRPWLRTGAHNNREAWVAMARKIVARCLEKNVDPTNHFALLGLRMENDIKTSIDSGAWEPNQGAYGKWKEARGKTKPLIVTGHMRASVRYVISQGDGNDNSQQSATT